MPSIIGALKRRAQRLVVRAAPSARYIDQAVRLIEVNADRTPSGRTSPVYGGVWDRWLSRYTGAMPASVIDLLATKKQFAVLVAAAACGKPHFLLIGARRSAKSETMAMWVIIRALLLPGKPISMMFPKHSKAKKFVERKVLPRARKLIAAYHRSPGAFDLVFHSGAVVWILSGKVVDDARGDGVATAGCDEKQICPTEAWDNVVLSLSEGGRFFQTMETGSALQGEFEEYVEKAKENDQYHVEFLTSFDNPFIDRRFLDDAKRMMDPRRYAQEVMAEFVPQTAIVYYPFERGTHVQRYADARRVLAARYGVFPGVGAEITPKVAYQWFRKQAQFIVGVDFNVSPMCGVVYRILQGPAGIADIWWGIDEVILDDRADATQLGVELKRRGYASAIVIPDASGQYSEGGRSSHRMLRDEGFSVFSPKKNPYVIDRVNAVNAKLMNQSSHVTLFFDPACVSTIKAFSAQRINLKTGTPEKDNTHEHRADAAGYPIVYLCPAAVATRDRGKDVYAVAR